MICTGLKVLINNNGTIREANIHGYRETQIEKKKYNCPLNADDFLHRIPKDLKISN